MPKKRTYYFTHDCNAREDDKIVALRMDKGAAGYGLYWLLLELLSTSPNCEFERNYNKVGFILHESAKDIKEVVENYGLFQIAENGKTFYSSRMKEQMESFEEVSEKRREAINKRWKAQRESGSKEEQVNNTCNTNVIQMNTEEDTSVLHLNTSEKEKERTKEKESKGKERKINLDSSPNVEESLSDWPSDNDSDSEENDVMIDYEKLISYWNLKTKKKWGELRTIQNERRRRVRARIRENGKETFIAAIEKACASQFLADASWFNFDWMICPNNFDKLITGNYDNKAQNNGNETTDTDRRKHVSKPTGGFSSDF